MYALSKVSKNNGRVKQIMKSITGFIKFRLALATALVLGLSAGTAQAAFLAPNTTGTITVTSGCFTFGTCVVGGLGNITDNSSMATTSGIGSAIAGDGIIGRMNFTVGANGNSLTLTSYNMDTYTGTAGGDFNTRMVNTSAATASISDVGVMSLNLAGRTGIAQFFVGSIGEQAWNIDSHANVPATAACFAVQTGTQTLFTTGTSTALNCNTGATAITIVGSNLGKIATGTWTGTLVSAGNVGQIWTGFDGVPYTEIYNITVTGTEPVVVNPCTPNAFTFTAQADVGLSQTITSNSQTIAGITQACQISVANGEYEVDGSGTWTNAPGSITAGQAVRVRHTSSALYSTLVTTTLTVGTLARPFNSTTIAPAFVCGSNFTMIDTGGGITGGANDVAMFWDTTSTTNNNSIDFTHMTLSSNTPFYGANWTAHHIRVFGPGTYTFNTNCTTAELEATGGCNTAGTPPLTMTVGAGQLGAHMLFNWSTDTNIDVVNVWNLNQVFGPSPMYTGGGGNRNMVWSLSSTDPDGDGKSGVPMVDGHFVGFNANFNLSTGVVACTTNTPPPMQAEDTNVESRLTAGCSLSATPVNPLERSDWWLLLGFVAWLGFVARRKRMMQ